MFSTYLPAPSAAVRLGAATSDRVNIPHTSRLALVETSVFSTLILARVTTFTSANRIWAKNATDGNGGPRLILNGTTEVRVTFAATVVNADALTTGVNWALGEWLWIGTTYDTTDSQECRIYTAKWNRPMTEASYASSAAHVGVSSSTALLSVGNNGEASPATAFQGDIAFFAMIIGTRLSRAGMCQLQLAAMQNQLMPASVWMPLGLPGKKQVDYSGFGNHGTLEGAFAVNNLPLTMTTKRRRFIETNSSSTTSARKARTYPLGVLSTPFGGPA